MSLYGVANSRSSSSSFSTGLNDSVSCTLVTVKEWLMLMGPQLCKQDFSIIQSFNCNRKYLSPFVPLVELPFVILPCLVLPKPKPFLGSFTLDAVASIGQLRYHREKARSVPISALTKSTAESA